MQEIKAQIDELVANSEWEQASVFARYFLRSAADLSYDGKALQEVKQVVKERNFADKVDEAERLRNEHRVRLSGYNSGKTYSRNRVLRYIEEVVSRAEFRPYIQQYVSAEIKDKIEDLRTVIDSFLSERMLDFALNNLGDPASIEMQYTRVFFTVAAKELEKIAQGLEAHNIFKNAILSDGIPESFGIVETI